MKLAPLSLMPALALGCWDVGKGADAHIPGDELGTYAVVATKANSSCGAGALAAPDKWPFEVRLSRQDPDLWWLNGREAVYGRIAQDGISFSFETWLQQELEPGGGARAPCRVTRADRAHGALSSPTLDVESFRATLAYAYAVAEGADCTEASPRLGLPPLPCELSFDLLAERTVAPSR